MVGLRQHDLGGRITVWQLFGGALIALTRTLPLLMLGGLYLLLDYLAGLSLLPTAVLAVCLASLPCSYLIVYDRARPTRYVIAPAVLALLLVVSPVDGQSRKPVFRAV